MTKNRAAAILGFVALSCVWAASILYAFVG